MFDEWKKRRELKRNIDQTKEKLSVLNRRSTTEQPNKDEQLKLLRILDSYKYQLAMFESKKLTETALHLGIEIPKHNGWWDSDYEEGMPSEAVTSWLNYKGRLAAAKLIREEKRKNIEWWVKIITPLLASLISILGLIVALITVSKK